MLPDRTQTPWLDLDPTDIDGEEWRELAAYSGFYQVSSYGRVKSMPRKGRLQPEIMHQRARSSALLVHLRHPSGRRLVPVRQLVVEGFGLVKPADHVWTQAGTNVLDNRVSNLISLTRSQIFKRSTVRGLRPQTEVLAVHSQAQKAARDERVGIFENGVMVAQLCSKCELPKPLSAFSTQRSGKGRRRERACRDCRNADAGVHVGKGRRAKELLAKGLRQCGTCQQEKPLDEQNFRKSQNPNSHGFNYTCLVCKPFKRLPEPTS